MTRTLLVALITLGDPSRLSGGYLYHQRLADLAPKYDAQIAFASFPERHFPLAISESASILNHVRRIGADAMVLDSIAAAFLGPLVSMREPAIPIIGMLHQPPGGIDHGRVRTALQARLDRLAYRRAKRILIASDALAADLTAQGIPAHKIRVVPPGRDVAASIEPTGDLRQGRSAAILCVGNWVERKGIHSLLEAFARLPQELATLHLAGDELADTHYGQRIRQRLDAPDLGGRVVVHGALTVEQVAGLYSAADVFVLPSLKEPYGTVYGEAMAFGLPVVGWRAGNLPYLATDEHEGLLVQPGDLDGLARAIRRLAENQTLRQQFGEAAARRAMERPTWEQTAEMFFNEIRAVVEPINEPIASPA